MAASRSTGSATFMQCPSQVIRPASLQPVHIGDQLGQPQHLVAGKLAAAVHAGVELDHGFRMGAERDGRFVELAGLDLAIDRQDQSGLGGQCGRAARLDRTDDLVRHHDVADAAGGHHLGFAQLGAGDADGARRELQMGDRRGLVGLAMRPPVRPARFDIGGHAS